MSEKIDLPSILPIFPLPKAILLPGSRLPLHIFEPRYLSMFEDALARGREAARGDAPAEEGEVRGTHSFVMSQALLLSE